MYSSGTCLHTPEIQISGFDQEWDFFISMIQFGCDDCFHCAIFFVKKWFIKYGIGPFWN